MTKGRTSDHLLIAESPSNHSNWFLLYSPNHAAVLRGRIAAYVRTGTGMLTSGTRASSCPVNCALIWS